MADFGFTDSIRKPISMLNRIRSRTGWFVDFIEFQLNDGTCTRNGHEYTELDEEYYHLYDGEHVSSIEQISAIEL